MYGISVILFAIPLIFSLIKVLEKMGKIKNKKSYILVLPILLLCSTYLFFSNNLFNILNIFIILALFAAMIIWALSEKLKYTLFFTKIFNVIIGPLEFVGKAISIIKNSIKGTGSENRKIQLTKRIIKALIISIPIILIILFLLISADDNFAKIFSGFADYIVKIFTSWEVIYFILRIVLIAVLFIYFVSFVYNLSNEKSSFNIIEKINQPKGIKIDIFTINTILTILNVLYAIFSIVQIVNLGDTNKIESLSSTARQGFFQLMVVSIINFIFIIITTINKAEESTAAKKYKKVMNILMLIFTIVLIIVSFQKMRLYVGKYGYTYLRILVFFTLLTEVILTIPTAIYVIKQKINLFYTYFAIIITMYIIMNFININKLIAKKNVDLYFETGKFDFYYLKKLDSTDSALEMKRLLNKIENDENLDRRVNNYLYDVKKDLEEEKITWQSFNFSKSKAKKEFEKLEIEYKNSYDKNNRNRYYYDYDEETI